MKRHYILLLMVAALLGACKDDTNPPKMQMSDLTKTAVGVSYHDATIVDTIHIMSDNLTVTFFYSTDSEVVTSDKRKSVAPKIEKGNGYYVVMSQLSGLTDNTEYFYVYGFASEFDTKRRGAEATRYSTGGSFRTLKNGAPLVETIRSSDYGFYTASVTVKKNSDNSDSKTTSWGVCYSTSSKPTLSDNIVKHSSNDNKQVVLSLKNLTPGTKYYFRAYAVNKYGTSYGEVMSFTTVSTSVMMVETKQVTSVGANNAILNGKISGEESLVVSERGFYISSTSQTPDENTTTIKSDVAAVGQYQCLANGLTSNTTYYVRAYAVCQYGKLYGNVNTFTTE